jgi:hypothetical protein
MRFRNYLTEDLTKISKINLNGIFFNNALYISIADIVRRISCEISSNLSLGISIAYSSFIF